MRLDIRMFGAEKSFRALDRKLFHNVYKFTTSVPALARVTLGILIGQDRPLGFEYGRGHKIFGSDQFDILILPIDFAPDRLKDFRINFF
jgi:hypothetical protein